MRPQPAWAALSFTHLIHSATHIFWGQLQMAASPVISSLLRISKGFLLDPEHHTCRGQKRRRQSKNHVKAPCQ
jgi:hypothetical protein